MPLKAPHTFARFAFFLARFAFFLARFAWKKITPLRFWGLKTLFKVT